MMRSSVMKSSMIKIAVLGAGVVGVTTAYALCKKGYQVCIVDQWDKAAMGSSFANGGQLSYSYKTPVANSKILRDLPAVLLGRDPALVVKPTLDFNFYRWGGRFLFECLPGRSKANGKVMQELADISRREFRSLAQSLPLDFDYGEESGKLYIFSEQKEYEKAIQSAPETDTYRYLSPDQVIDQVPALSGNRDNIAGAVFSVIDESGDPHAFCNGLIQYMVDAFGLTVHYGHTLSPLSANGAFIESVETNKGSISADAYVLATGVQSASIVANLGIKLPIYPMKGYSVTVPATDACPDVSMTDTRQKTVYCKLGDRLRIAGVAEFSGYDMDINEKQIKRMLDNARVFLPDAGDYDRVLNQWCGLRPLTPDSLPIIGQSKYSNLYLNVGHGMLGWTHGMGSAFLLEKAISEPGYMNQYPKLHPERFRFMHTHQL